MVLFNQELRDKEIHTFPKGIKLKVNIIAQLDFGFVYNVTILHIIKFTIGAPPGGLRFSCKQTSAVN